MSSRPLIVLLIALCAVPRVAAQTGAPAASTTPAPTHRSLRSNSADAPPPEPTTPGEFHGYAGAPPFTVVPQKDGLVFFPCSGCHAAMQPNPVPRLLAAPHPAALNHGAGRLWCLDCHQTKDRDQLHTIAGKPVDFNDAYLVCGQCHFRQQKEWYFGAHGKRVANWKGQREIYNCTHCHDPHAPALKPRAPSPPPPVRAGLERPRHP